MIFYTSVLMFFTEFAFWGHQLYFYKSTPNKIIVICKLNYVMLNEYYSFIFKIREQLRRQISLFI